VHRPRFSGPFELAGRLRGGRPPGPDQRAGGAIKTGAGLTSNRCAPSSPIRLSENAGTGGGRGRRRNGILAPQRAFLGMKARTYAKPTRGLGRRYGDSGPRSGTHGSTAIGPGWRGLELRACGKCSNDDTARIISRASKPGRYMQGSFGRNDHARADGTPCRLPGAGKDR